MGKTGRFGRVNPAKDVHFGRANQAKNVHLSRVGKPSKNRPFYPRGQTKKKLSILPEWVNSVKNVHFTRVGKPSKNCPFYPRLSILVDQSIHSTKLVIPPGTICTKHEIILARVSTLQSIAIKGWTSNSNDTNRHDQGSLQYISTWRQGGRAGTLGSEVTLQLIGVLLCLMLDYAHRCRTSTLIMVPIQMQNTGTKRSIKYSRFRGTRVVSVFSLANTNIRRVVANRSTETTDVLFTVLLFK